MTKSNYRLILVVSLVGWLVTNCAPGVAVQSPTRTLPVASDFVTVTPTEMLLPTTQPVPATSIPPSPTQSGPKLQLTFVSDRSGKYGVYAIAVNCLESDELCLSEPQLFFEWDERISAIDWSPDGERLVFESEGRLYVAEWNGENATQIVTAPGRASWPQWSPEGTQIAYIFAALRLGTEMLEPYQVKIFDLATGQVMPLFEGIYDPTRIVWLSGEQMAYVAKGSETDWLEHINIVKPDGRVLRQVPENAEAYTSILGLDFSPDSGQLAFVGEVNPSTGKTTRDIYIISLGEAGIINLTKGFGNNYSPKWSSLGDWIAFESNRDNNYEIYIVKSDGARLIRVTEATSEDGVPAWRHFP